MGNPVHLTADEQKLFEALPAAVKAVFKKRIETEIIDAYETEAELKERLRNASFTSDPRARLLAEKVMHKLARSENLDDLSLDELPEQVLSSVLYGMGAVGISAIIELMLADAKNTETVEAIGLLSRARNKVLRANAASRS